MCTHKAKEKYGCGLHWRGSKASYFDWNDINIKNKPRPWASYFPNNHPQYYKGGGSQSEEVAFIKVNSGHPFLEIDGEEGIQSDIIIIALSCTLIILNTQHIQELTNKIWSCVGLGLPRRTLYKGIYPISPQDLPEIMLHKPTHTPVKKKIYRKCSSRVLALLS